MAETALDIVPRPRRDLMAGLIVMLALAGLIFALALVALGATLAYGHWGVALRFAAMLAGLGITGWLLLRGLRRLSDPRPALAIRPEGLTLPRLGPAGAPLRLRWDEIETFGVPGAGTEFPRLHIGLTAAASAARGVAVAHLAPDIPHLGNRLRYWQGLAALSLPPDQIIAALLASAATAGAPLVPAETSLAQRVLEGSPHAFPRWQRQPAG